MSEIIQSRRGFITGLVAFVAAPAIVRVSSIMPVKVMEPSMIYIDNLSELSDRYFHKLVHHARNYSIGPEKFKEVILRSRTV